MPGWGPSDSVDRTIDDNRIGWQGCKVSERVIECRAGVLTQTTGYVEYQVEQVEQDQDQEDVEKRNLPVEQCPSDASLKAG